MSSLTCSEFGQTRPQGAFPCLWRWGGKSALGTRLEVGEKRTLVRLLASDRRFDEMQYRTKTASHTQLEKKKFIRLLQVVNGYVSNMQFVYILLNFLKDFLILMFP